MEETWKMLWRFAEDHDLRGAYGENITFEIEACDEEKEHLALAKKRDGYFTRNPTARMRSSFRQKIFVRVGPVSKIISSYFLLKKNWRNSSVFLKVVIANKIYFKSAYLQFISLNFLVGNPIGSFVSPPGLRSMSFNFCW